MNIKKLKLFLLGLPKTFLFNFHYFDFKTAVKFPVWLTHKVRLKSLKGIVHLETSQIRRGMISIGFAHVSINDTNEYSLWNVEGTVIFNGRAQFGAGSKIAVGKKARLKIGDNFLITARTEIACFKEITFGKDCLLSWDILIMDTDAHPIFSDSGDRINHDQPIKIGSHSWIGCRSTILKGTILPNNTIVGAYTLISKKFVEENSVIVGNAATVVKRNVNFPVENY